MERKSYRFLWWLLALALLAGIICYAIAHNREKEYSDGTFVWQCPEGCIMSDWEG